MEKTNEDGGGRGPCRLPTLFIPDEVVNDFLYNDNLLWRVTGPTTSITCWPRPLADVGSQPLRSISAIVRPRSLLAKWPADRILRKGAISGRGRGDPKIERAFYSGDLLRQFPI